jgi:hypothetical protein
VQIEEREMLSSRETFRSLVREAEAADFGLALEALSSAEENANDTERLAYGTEAYYDIALGSICDTAAFNEHKSVRDWLTFHGYRW